MTGHGRDCSAEWIGFEGGAYSNIRLMVYLRSPTASQWLLLALYYVAYIPNP